MHELGKSTLTMVLFTGGKEINISDIDREVKVGEKIYRE